MLMHFKIWEEGWGGDLRVCSAGEVGTLLGGGGGRVGFGTGPLVAGQPNPVPNPGKHVALLCAAARELLFDLGSCWLANPWHGMQVARCSKLPFESALPWSSALRCDGSLGCVPKLSAYHESVLWLACDAGLTLAHRPERTRAARRSTG